MTDPRLEDHATGLELQIIELVEQQERARVQHRDGDADRLQREIDSLRGELAATAEELSAPVTRAEDLIDS